MPARRAPGVRFQTALVAGLITGRAPAIMFFALTSNQDGKSPIVLFRGLAAEPPGTYPDIQCVIWQGSFLALLGG